MMLNHRYRVGWGVSYRGLHEAILLSYSITMGTPFIRSRSASACVISISGLAGLGSLPCLEKRCLIKQKTKFHISRIKNEVSHQQNEISNQQNKERGLTSAEQRTKSQISKTKKEVSHQNGERGFTSAEQRMRYDISRTKDDISSAERTV